MIGAVDYTMATAIECRTPEDAARLALALEYAGYACAASHRVVDTSASELEARTVATRLVARGSISEPCFYLDAY